MYVTRDAMTTKLTLRLDGALIARAKRYAAQSGTSVSQLVADYFALIQTDDPIPGSELTPNVRAVLGLLRGVSVTEDDYRRHLDEKHG